jgi:hypothetical protein
MGHSASNRTESPVNNAGEEWQARPPLRPVAVPELGGDVARLLYNFQTPIQQLETT